MRVMHILHRSVPGAHGYAVRSRRIVLSLQKKGVEQIVATSPSQAPLGELDAEKSELIDEVRYYRTCSGLLAPTKEVRDDSAVRSALRVLQNASLFWTALKAAERFRPDVIHAHSPFTCGLVANEVGRRKGIPAIYEVRGVWEDSHAGRGKFTQSSLRYRAARRLETKAMNGADACCAICDGLAEEIRSRGVSADRILVVPNGVDPGEFRPGPRPVGLSKRLGLDDALTMGYIGYFFLYEGLDLLLAAAPLLLGDFPFLKLLLVGDGEVMGDLRRLAQTLRISDKVVFTGRVPHLEITDYYRLCDLLVLPRRETRETRLVTPLKPLEIMAMSKAVVASDIGGHREIIQDGLNGALFASGDCRDLAAKCRRLLGSDELRMEIGRRSRKWIEDYRDWNVLADRYVSLYSSLAGTKNRLV